MYPFQKCERQAKRCFALGTRLRGCDGYLVLPSAQAGCLNEIFRPSEYSDGLIPIRKTNLTSLSRLAVLSVLSQASALLAYFFEWV